MALLLTWLGIMAAVAVYGLLQRRRYGRSVWNVDAQGCAADDDTTSATIVGAVQISAAVPPSWNGLRLGGTSGSSVGAAVGIGLKGMVRRATTRLFRIDPLGLL